MNREAIGRLVHWHNHHTPLPRGRALLALLAQRLGAVPREAPAARLAGGIRMDLRPHDFIDGLVYFNNMDPEVGRAIRERVRPGSCAWDVGANIGYYTLLLARAGGAVEAFEPDPDNRARLEANVRLNGLDGSIRIHDLALADREGEGVLQTVAGDHGESSIAPRSIHDSARVRPRACRLATADALVASGRLRAPDFVKVDVEGAELLVLRGARSTIEAARPPLVCELNARAQAAFGYGPADLVRELADRGYVAWLLTKHGRPIPLNPDRAAGVSFGNALFVSAAG